MVVTALGVETPQHVQVCLCVLIIHHSPPDPDGAVVTVFVCIIKTVYLGYAARLHKPDPDGSGDCLCLYHKPDPDGSVTVFVCIIKTVYLGYAARLQVYDLAVTLCTQPSNPPWCDYNACTNASV